MAFSQRIRKYIGYSVLIILLLIFSLFYYQLSTYYPFNPFFPPSGKTTHFMELTYPPISNGEVQELLLDACFNVVSNKPIAVGINMTIANPRVIFYGGTPRNRAIIYNISGINIAFQNAQPMGGSLKVTVPFDINHSQLVYHINKSRHVYYNLPPGASFQVDKNYIKFPSFPREQTYELNLSNGYLHGIRQNQPFSFSVSGDYSPSIILEFRNGTYESYTYDEMKLHVPSASEIQTQELSQIGGFIAIILLIFSFFEALKLVNEWIKGPH